MAAVLWHSVQEDFNSGEAASVLIAESVHCVLRATSMKR